MAGRSKKLSVEDQIALKRDFDAGESVNTLSKRYSVSVRQVYRTAKEQRGETVSGKNETDNFAFRAPRAEVEGFLKLAKDAGIDKKSAAFRSLLRMAQGLVELFPRDFSDFNKSAWLVRKEGQLLNQLAKSVHKGKLRLSDGDRVLLSKSIDANERLLDELRSILDAHKTRRGFAEAALKHDAKKGREL